MKILLLGGSGQLGWELRRSLAPIADLVVATRHEGEHRIDLADGDALEYLVRACAPQGVVNAAAFTAVDAAQTQVEQAQLLNAALPGRLGRVCADIGAWVIHYSTDYVFDGQGSRPWRETDPTGPLNVYGQSKLEGEQALAAACADHLILRTSWVYAARGQNFAKTMLRLARERERLSVVADQWGAPTGADWLADATAHALVRWRGAGAAPGLYHLCADGETNWHAYAQHVLRRAMHHGERLRASADGVIAVRSEDYRTAARRPLNSRLDCSRFEAAFGLRRPHWSEGVDRMLEEILKP